MPLPDTVFILSPDRTQISFALEPAQNVLNSMLLLNKVDKVSGFNEWITTTAAAMSPELALTNRVVLEGLHHAIFVDASWSSFPAYLNYLSLQEPTELRDAVLHAYHDLGCKPADSTSEFAEPIDMLATLGTFLDYLGTHFRVENVDIAIETEAYRLLTDPPTMKEVIVSHLKQMWDMYFAVEWERVTPLLHASIEAFGQLELADLALPDAIEQITGRALPEKLGHILENNKIDQLIFVPSAHVGPYLSMVKGKRIIWLIFGARFPEGARENLPDLSRTELLVRLSALADDTRLRILHYFAVNGEQVSKDVMSELGLSQSAASRHLKQLTATGYLDERWKDGSKCYNLNRERIGSTLDATNRFFSVSV